MGLLALFHIQRTLFADITLETQILLDDLTPLTPEEWVDLFGQFPPPPPNHDEVTLPDLNQGGDGINENLVGDFNTTQEWEFPSTPYIPTEESSTGLDQDNDVPMLTNIYNRLAELDQDNDVPTLQAIHDRMKVLNEDTRGLRFNVENNQTSSEYTTLRDLHIELQKIRMQTADINKTLIDSVAKDMASNVSESQSEIADSMASLESKLQNSEVKISAPSKEHSSAFIDVPQVLQKTLKRSTIDLFNADGSLPIPKLADMAKFVSLVIGLVAVFIYSQAIKKLLDRTLEIMISANESNTVTNYSLLGNSVGALSVKAIKTGLTFTLVMSVLVAITAVFAETFDFTAGGITTTGSSEGIITQISDKLVSFGIWSEMAMYWFFKFVPIISILYMIFQYWLASFGVKGLIFAQNRAIRVAS